MVRRGAKVSHVPRQPPHAMHRVLNHSLSLESRKLVAERVFEVRVVRVAL